MKAITRRTFVKTASGIALAASIPAGVFAQEPGLKKLRVAVLYDESLPPPREIPLTRDALQRALASFDAVYLTADELGACLRDGEVDVYVNPYGSMFPKPAFQAILRYLHDGGNWVNVGGVPFSIPADPDSGGWRTEARQTAYHKELGITQAFPVQCSGLGLERPEDRSPETGITADEAFELYVLFATTKDFPSEDGSAGSRDAEIRPLITAVGSGNHAIAAPIVEIDRFQGRFAGGRWILANFSGSVTPATLQALVGRAAEGASLLRVSTSFACYRPGELPSLTVRALRPKGNLEVLINEECRIRILNEDGNTIETLRTRLHGEGTVVTGFAGMKSRSLAPGLYEASASIRLPSAGAKGMREIGHSTGFWVTDERLMSGGVPFTLDRNYLLREGDPYPVTGTTYMASDVHRKFLFEPNPYLWSRDLGRMKEAGINMLRTGIWTGWRNVMFDVGAPNEGALRAMDAFLLTARRHNMPVIVTLFAFLPEAWNGANAYLDPRSVNAQKEFVLSFVNRYRDVNDVIWDLINEPSFCNPQHLWTCRPNYDEFEAAAWDGWLRKRYPASSEEEWLSALQERFHMTSGEAPALPKLEEFDDANVFNDKRPAKVVDYRLFAQEMFSRWAADLKALIRRNANPRQLVTVGQDEGGTYEGPSPQFFGDSVDFTCIHNWWLNDNLLWDSIVSKVSGKPNLVEETGVMFAENTDGSAWRNEEETRNLLERKLAIAVGSGCAGFVEWIWNTNPYMKSENEAAIGLLRADGTAKPEIEPVSALAKFLAKHRGLMRGREAEDVLMVIPHSQMFSTRNFASDATQRCVRVMNSHCRVAVSAVSEYGLEGFSGFPKLIVAPSPRTINENAWKALLGAVETGSVLLVSGNLDADDHSLVVPRTQALGIEVRTRPVVQEEFLTIDGTEHLLSYRGDKIQKVEKAVVRQDGPASVLTIRHGKGVILWSPLPVEISDSVEPCAALYSVALKQAGIQPPFTIGQNDPSVLVLPGIFQSAVLYTLVSESDRDTEVRLTHRETGTPVNVTLPAQRAAMVFVNRKDGEIISRL